MYLIDLFNNIGLDKVTLHNTTISNSSIVLSYDNYTCLAINNSSTSYTSTIVQLNINDDNFNVFTKANNKNQLRFWSDSDYTQQLDYNIISFDNTLDTQKINVLLDNIPSNSSVTFYFDIDNSRITNNSNTSLTYTTNDIYVTYGITYQNSGYILSPVIDLTSTTYVNVFWNQIINQNTGIGNISNQQIEYYGSNISPDIQYTDTFNDDNNVSHKYWNNWGSVTPTMINVSNNEYLQFYRYFQFKIILLSPLDQINSSSLYLWDQSNWDNGIWV